MRLARPQLEHLVLDALRDVPGCENAEAVFLTDQIDLFESNSNWEVAAFDSGRADPKACESGLLSVVPTMQRRYLLI